MGVLMEGTEPSQYFRNFQIAAGLEEGQHDGPPFNDGDFYKWLEAASAVFAVTRDPAIDRRMDAVISVVARAQRPDGYLHTPVLIRRRNGDPSAEPFQDRLNFEMYNLGHLFTAACVHHRATGKDDLLKVAVRAADWLDSAFRKPTPELAQSAVCPSHYMGLVELYRTTRDAKYLRLAEALVNLRDRVEGGSDDNQDRIPFRKQTEAVGHAVRANYLYAGAADVYAETGDRSLLDTLQTIWEDLVTQLTREPSRQHLEQLARLEQAHGVRLNTIRDRLAFSDVSIRLHLRAKTREDEAANGDESKKPRRGRKPTDLSLKTSRSEDQAERHGRDESGLWKNL